MSGTDVETEQFVDDDHARMGPGAIGEGQIRGAEGLCSHVSRSSAIAGAWTPEYLPRPAVAAVHNASNPPHRPCEDRAAERSEAGLKQHVFSAIVQPLVTPVLCGWEYAFDGGRIAGQLDERSFGQVDPNGTQASPRTPFVLGSTTKAITALAVMQLVGGGRVTLDDRVQRYLPWFRVADPRASAEMTVRQLLNQTSGLDS